MLIHSPPDGCFRFLIQKQINIYYHHFNTKIYEEVSRQIIQRILL